MFNDERDYVVAVHLPFMLQEHDTDVARVRDFTVGESHQMYLDDYPVYMNHNDGTYDTECNRQRERDLIGKVDAMQTNGVTGKVLLSIDPSLSEAATFASNAIATGIYCGVSLGHDVRTRVRASSHEMYYQKTPNEVSVVRAGRRPGSDIEHFCPGRATIERLYDAAPDDLDKLVALHGYASHLIDRNVVRNDRTAYIDALTDISHKRLARVVASESLYRNQQRPVAGNTMDQVNASETHRASENEAQLNAAATATEPPPSLASSVDKNEASTEKLVDGNASSPPSIETSTSGNVPNVRNAQEMAALAYQREKELVEMRLKMAEAERKAKLYDAKIDQELAKQKEKFEQVIKSFTQHAEKDKRAPHEVDLLVSCARDEFARDPTRANEMMQSHLAMAVRASDQNDEMEKLRAQSMITQANAHNDAVFDRYAQGFASLRSQDLDFKFDTQPKPSGATGLRDPTSNSTFSSRFETPSTATPESSTKRETIETSATESSQLQPAREFTAPRLFVSTGGANDYTSSQGQFIEQSKRLGRFATYNDVAHPIYEEATGEVKQSADGERVPVMRVKRQKTRAAVEAATFAPDFHEMLVTTMHDRMKARSFSPLTMVQRGGTVEGL